jgi:hypothetical protein
VSLFRPIYRILPAFLAILVGINLMSCTEPTPLPDPGPRAMWVWDYSWVDKPAEASALLTFAKNNQIDTFFLESGAVLSDRPARLEEFIHQAAAQQIQVELLFGGNEWIERPETALALAKQASNFIAGMSEPKASAIHFDVEPHALPGWDEDKQYFASLYLDLLDRLRPAVGSTPLHVDIGHFYAKVDVSRAGINKSLLSWVLERVDGATLMAYNSNPQTVLAFVADEFKQSQGTGKKLRVGLACECSLTPLENYCSHDSLNTALSTVRQSYGSHPNFAGLAVQAYAAYRTLK